MKIGFVLAVLSALPCLAAGRLELFTAPAEQLVQGTWDIGSASASDKMTARFRIRNTGDAPVSLTTLRIAGTGFSITGSPSLPHIVAAGTNVDFIVEFRPPDFGSYSGNLLVNSTGYVIRASGLAALGVFQNGRPLSSGDGIDAGRVEVGQETALTFELRNTTAQAAGITRATVTGPAFAFVAGAPTVWLQPGQSTSFTVRFRPASASVFQERLTLDDRTYVLTGTGTAPPVPRPILTIETPVLRSGEQGKLSIRLSQKASARGTGRVRMELRPDGRIADNDAAAQFLNGSRIYDYQINENDTFVSFNGSSSLTFQAGTTAGTIVFTVESGGFTDQAVVGIGPEPVRIDRASAVRNSGSISAQIVGFDNMRTVSEVNFTFFSKSGQPIAVRVPAARDFERWWAESRLGGIFSYRAVFPVTGDASQITGLEVEIVNSLGTSRTQRLTF